MGYILPINHEQYTQYVNRSTSYKTNQFRLHHVNPITLHTSVKNQYERIDTRLPQRRIPKPNNEKVRAQITGLGLLYDATI
ncbi:hypothetical protein [Fredinandcohnia sp. 179-A 10B2 NHS]|uniref:hypothetical protein n=1 Tax=Fredinandcohnia sp. 179-A 10B2 NHS TaxID=3235176 RepID=UPI0039A188EC